MNDFFNGKRILITGGAQRVGAYMAEFFAGFGATVLIHANKSVEQAQTLARKINGEYYFCDLEKIDTLENFFNRLGRVDVLINNASCYETAPLADESAKSMIKHYNINFIAPVILAQCMKKQNLPGSVILNILDREISLRTPDKGSYLISRKALAEATLELAPVFMSEKSMSKTIAASPLKRTASLHDLCEAAAMLISNTSLTGQIIQVDAGQHLNS